MNEVQPLQDTTDIQRISEFLLTHYSQTFSDYWLFGCCVALRVSDLLAIKFSDIRKRKGIHYLIVKEAKTGKSKEIELNIVAAEIFTRRAKQKGDVFLFRSNWKYHTETKPLSRSAFSKAVQDAAPSLELVIGTHSMRKTLGYHTYKRTNDLALVQKILGHSSSAHTLRYIGINAEKINQQFAANYF
ncbi:tyrosine-type recombinase/integrase [Teredinibacter franksiae]|uniref:tyrosine-type recombinase/integrase n=1 Tax=Teredinibacter franksiae TaxID=2761453 RepID=UPI0016286B70|nr:tyrosine-type recombinase/integrase [Teredinibacter franksiae]